MCQPQRGEGRGTGGSSPGLAVRVCGMQAGKTASNCLGGPRTGFSPSRCCHINTPGKSSWWGGRGTVKIQRGQRQACASPTDPWRPSPVSPGDAQHGSPHARGRRAPGQLIVLHVPLPPARTSLVCTGSQRCQTRRPWRPTFWGICRCIALTRALHCSPEPTMACMPAEEKGAPASRPRGRLPSRDRPVLPFVASSRSGS